MDSAACLSLGSLPTKKLPGDEGPLLLNDVSDRLPAGDCCFLPSQTGSQQPGTSGRTVFLAGGVGRVKAPMCSDSAASAEAPGP
jgi:hypothetical protein